MNIDDDVLDDVIDCVLDYASVEVNTGNFDVDIEAIPYLHERDKDTVMKKLRELLKCG